jgi:hypothetical protein
MEKVNRLFEQRNKGNGMEIKPKEGEDEKDKA